MTFDCTSVGGLVTSRVNQVIRELELWVFPHFQLLGREEGLMFQFRWDNCQWLNQSRLYNETSIKILKDKVHRASGLVNQWRFRRSGLGEGREALCPFSIPCPIHLFHLAIPESYLFIINQCSIRLVPKELQFCTVEICHLILEYILKQMWLCYTSF